MNEKLQLVALTGGIATGKSTVARLFEDLYPSMVLFDADSVVRSLYANEEVIREIVDYFGHRSILQGGELDRAYLRHRAFAFPADRQFLEGVFHPRVREECLALLEISAKRAVSRLFVADIPLLFESGFDFGQSANLMVATSQATQVARLKKRNAWDDETVNGVICSQMPISAKMARADVVFWNEGPLDVLRRQCRRFIHSLGIGQ
ncbi:dephospho-CoA kinase [Verrucomicrobiaceae bacterium N1E253]|uniref:Dephospho-CoA kinase n=1 Tax=Oceaniferula marina TaxID=2748318 RepID=A0A851GMJ7_9BACT|nr:dephospho-CoA kinase [Oceaniferula marina]NWK56267.1 dephospho-CoA kinase [Oceaniferula marina]